MGITLILLISFSAWMFLAVKLIEKDISPAKSFGGGFACAFLLFLILSYVFIFDNKKEDKESAGVETSAAAAPAPQHHFAVDLTPEQQQDAALIGALERMVTACPSLQKYAPDFSRARVENNSGYFFYLDKSGMRLTFKVSDHPQYLPSPLNVRSAGNTCFFDINGAGTLASVAKGACKSLCQGKWIEGNGENMQISLDSKKLPVTTNPENASSAIGMSKQQLNADAIVAGLPLKSKEKTTSGNGRLKYLWRIDGLDNELAKFEIIGNDQRDADTVAWNCSKYDAAGNRESLKANNNPCYAFFVSVVRKISPNAEQIVERLVSGQTVVERVANLSIETGDDFFFVRNTERQ